MQEQNSIQNQQSEPQVPIRTDGLSAHAREFFDSVARRAYEIFESKGKRVGADLENWLQAEQELFERTPLRLSESPERVWVVADVHEYKPKELEIDLEPRRVTIVGKHDSSEQRKHDEIAVTKKSGLLLSLQLPVEVDPKHATAHMKRGMLELDIAKARVLQTRQRQGATQAA